MALTSMFKLHAPSPPLAAYALLTVNTRTIFDKIKFHLAGNLAGIIFGKMAPNGCKYNILAEFKFGGCKVKISLRHPCVHLVASSVIRLRGLQVLQWKRRVVTSRITTQ